MSSLDKTSLTRRKFLIASGTLFAGATLAACGAPAAAPKAAEPAAPAAPAAAEPAKAAEPTKAPEPTPAIGEYGTGGTPTVLWHGLGGADGAVFAHHVAGLCQDQQQPVRSETYNWDVFFQKIPPRSPPALRRIGPSSMPPKCRRWPARASMQPLDDLFYKSKGIDKGDFAKAVMDVLTVEGKTMAVPFDNHGWNCYVNTELVARPAYTAETLPKNGDEFIKFALKVTVDEAGKHPDESWL